MVGLPDVYSERGSSGSNPLPGPQGGGLDHHPERISLATVGVRNTQRLAAQEPLAHGPAGDAVDLINATDTAADPNYLS